MINSSSEEYILALDDRRLDLEFGRPFHRWPMHSKIFLDSQQFRKFENLLARHRYAMNGPALLLSGPFYCRRIAGGRMPGSHQMNRSHRSCVITLRSFQQSIRSHYLMAAKKILPSQAVPTDLNSPAAGLRRRAAS